MKDRNTQQTSTTEDVLVRNVDRELYRLFCHRTAELGVPVEAVLQEILIRGMSEWIRMRAR